jgi:hypothetical protein
VAKQVTSNANAARPESAVAGDDRHRAPLRARKELSMQIKRGS